MKQLESALIKRDISPEIAHKHVSNIRRTFTSEDLSEINSMHTVEEINALADSIAAILKKSPQPLQKTNNTPDASVSNNSDEISQSAQQTRQVPYHPPKAVDTKVAPKEQKSYLSEMSDDYFTYSNEVDPSTKGLTLFWVGLFVTLPLTLALLAVIFGAFAGLFVGLTAAIILSIVAMIGIVAAGSVVSLVGIIYGVTQLFSFVAAGVYEIGLGALVAGLVLFASVLLYNLALRFIPWLMKKIAKLLGYVCRKLKLLFYYIRRECYKL
ncbi:MAG: hypothetical protein E7628_01405 [Ruminococcaceae bacterium]|nr:hypothetical protein [Oscillospiraceae bacterium]